jgi:hypothetical protein
MNTAFLLPISRALVASVLVTLAAIDFKYTGAEYPGGEAGHTLALVGYIAKEDVYILCNPASPRPVCSC